MSAVSNQRLNLRPTSRSMPTRWNPHASWSAREAVAAGFDPGHHSMEAAGLGGVQQAGEEGLADAEALAVPAHVDGVLHRGAVGGALLVRRDRREPDHLAVPLGHQHAEGA